MIRLPYSTHTKTCHRYKHEIYLWVQAIRMVKYWFMGPHQSLVFIRTGMYQETEAAVLMNTKKLFGALSLKILWAAVGPGTITAQALVKVHGIGVSSARMTINTVVQGILCLGKLPRGLYRDNLLVGGPFVVLVRHRCCLLISAALVYALW
jgi:hypothetical protein